MKAAATFAAGGGTRAVTLFGVGAPVARPDPIRAPIGPTPRLGSATIAVIPRSRLAAMTLRTAWTIPT